jgi:hypothetical protein
VYNDPLFSGLEESEFDIPAGFNIELDCGNIDKESSSRSGNLLRDRY